MSIYNLNNKVFSKFTGLNVIIIVIVSLFFLRNSIYAQDIHFSQLLSTPVITNPANTGMSGEDMRIAINYRNQWAKVGTPYETFSASLDRKLAMLNQSFGIGGVILHDQSSSFNLSANTLGLRRSNDLQQPIAYFRIPKSLSPFPNLAANGIVILHIGADIQRLTSPLLLEFD